ncbi:MAG: long-chain-fatty-acid--CoA ligase [Candidatus Thermoplasmatota archaeon]|nr:long-chain-fatty-acid--CoA ligase [Candidatus Thermoplasmatota archaeon]MCL5731004.1 long-chain-fatty-acid--CoA ligase [Candidatus Thermoplasmatota archaeon]
MEDNRFELTLDKILITATRNSPSQVISYRGEKHVTYREFSQMVYSFARALLKNGLKKGEKVGVMDWDSITYMVAYYAVPIAGGIIHTVNIRYSPELIYYTMKHADDRFVIIRDEFVPMIQDKVELFDFVSKWIITSDKEEVSNRMEGSLSAEEMMKYNGKEELPDLNEDDTATTFYTSGTTGLPKGVSFTHRQIMLHTMVLSSILSDEPFDLKSSDVLMPMVPMFHVHSWGVPFSTLMRGMKYVLPGRYDFNAIPDIIRKEKVTMTLMVPSILYMILSNPEGARAMRENHVKVAVGGGGISEGLAARAKKEGIMVAAAYGMSETAPLLSISTYTNEAKKLPEEELDKIRTFYTTPAPLVEMKVVGEDGKEVPWDSSSIGEIVVRAPWLTSGYTNDPEGTERLWKDGWMHTGDLAVVNSTGYIKIVDREKDAVKSGGEFIPTLILEDAISTFPGVAEVAVIGKKDEKWGERPVAFISGLTEIDETKMREHLMSYVNSGRISKFWIPDEFRTVKEFEKTSTGKIDKKALREMIQN